MPYEYSDMIENIVESSVVISGVRSTLSLAAYVFCALALYTIARRRCIKKPWLAWIPVVNVWILGSISDQYRYVVKGEVRNKRKVLLTISIISAMGMVLLIGMIIGAIALPLNAFFSGADTNTITGLFVGKILRTLLLVVPMAVIKIMGFVFELMALYDVYTSCEPANNVLYLILSIIPGLNQITTPLFLFLCRNQDDGMPPRREATVEYTEM